VHTNNQAIKEKGTYGMETTSYSEEPTGQAQAQAHGQEQGQGQWTQFALIGVGLLLWWLIYSQLEAASIWLTTNLFGLSLETHLGSAVQFFIYDTPKVLLLLVLVVFFVGIIRTFFTPTRTRAILANQRESVGNVLAALLGIVTPFCSCSAVPLFIGFVTAGVPLGVTFSFLIAAPMVNEVALVLLYGLFGWKVTLLYLSTGLVIAIIAGWVIGRLKMEHHVEEWVSTMQAGSEQDTPLSWTERIQHGREAVQDIVGKVWLFVVAGIAIGAVIHGYVPEDFMASMMGEEVWWAVPLAVVMGIPMYTNAAGIIPIIEALIGKGAALGTALAFMMSVIALSLPEMIILRKVLKPRLIATFIGVVGAGILFVGYLFNTVL
jgi:uncharacterized membrane protein YraQ (UPF0718 family)